MNRRIFMPGVLLIAFYSMGAPISFVNYKFDPLKGMPELKSSLTVSEKEGENYYLLQFTGPIYPEWKREISKLGVKFYQYVPHYAYVVKMDKGIKEKVKKLSYVRWIGLYQPAFKIHPYVFIKPQMEEKNPLPRIELHIKGKTYYFEKVPSPEWKDVLWIEDDPYLHLSVRVFPDEDIVKIANLLFDMGADIQEIFPSSNRIILRLSPELLDSLARIEGVNTIAPQGPRTLHSSAWRYGVQTDSFTAVLDTDLNEPWDTVTSGITLADKGIDGDGEIVTIYDSGLDYWSGFFQDPENDPPGVNHVSVREYTDEGGNLQEVYPCVHGTNVSSIVAGDVSIADNHPNGGNMMPYYDWGGQTRGNTVDYFPVKLYIQDFAYKFFFWCLLGTSDYPACLQSAYNLGSRIHQNSWGYNSSYAGNYEAEAIDVDQFMWDNKDFLVVYSAGNDGPDPNTVSPPGTAKNCICVSAAWLPTYDVPYDSICWFSSRAYTDDGRLKPEIAAPGGADTTYNNNTADYREYVWGASSNNSWAADSAHGKLSGMMGTSQAAPQVSAAAAMVRQYFLDGFYPDGYAGSGPSINPSAALIKAVLITATVDMGVESEKGTPVPNPAEGWGKLVLDNALYFSGENRKLFIADISSGVSTGEYFDTTVVVGDASQDVKFVLTWVDTPAAANVIPTLINDLDLIVIDPNGVQYYGNVFLNGYSTTGGSPDTLNTVEVVWLAPAKAPIGVYTIRVYGRNVPNGPVPFAISGAGGFSSLGIHSTCLSCLQDVNGARLVWNLHEFPKAIGFNILRSEKAEEKGIRINENFIPISGSGTYTFLDRKVEPGRTYYYTIELVKDTGKRFYYGPVRFTAGEKVEEGFSEIMPNPFTEKVNLHFTVKEEAPVDLSIFDVAGRKISTLVKEKLSPGNYSQVWYSNHSGTYFAVLKIGDKVYRKKLIRTGR